MARRSAFENLHRKLEEASGEDGGDVNIDIEVVVDADGDAAEDIIEATEIGEAEGEADAVADADEAAQQEAEDMQELAAVLRKHGLNAGMAAILEVLVPMDAYGIVMPAKESLDASGRNQDKANRLAAAFEASDDGFWAKTGNFFKQIWQWIKDQCSKIFTMAGRLKTRIERTGKALDKRTFAPDRNKDKKIKKFKGSTTTAKDLTWVNSKLLDEIRAFSPTNLLNEIAADKTESTPADQTNDTKSPGSERWRTGYEVYNDAAAMEKDIKSKITNEQLKTIGYKWKNPTEGDKNATDLKLEDDPTNFLELEDGAEVTAEILGKYKYQKDEYNAAAAMCTFLDTLKLYEKIAKDNIKNAEKLNAAKNMFKDKESESVKNDKKKIGLMRDFLSTISKILTRTIKVAVKTCNLYVSNGRIILSCTKSTDSKVEYKG